MRIDLGGKRALVTGSTSGMGLAIAKGLAEAGAAVVVHGRSDQRVAAACQRLSAEVPAAQLSGCAADLADAAAVARLAATAGRVDVLVSNAGPIEARPFFDIPDDDWQRFFDIYVMATVRLARHHVREMAERGWGRVLISAAPTSAYMPGEMVHWGPARPPCSACLAGWRRTWPARA